MKKLFLLLCFFAAATTLPAQFLTDKLSPALQEALQTRPNERQPVYLMLADQVDLDALRASWGPRPGGIAERAPQVVVAMQAKAAATQPAVLERLKAFAAEYDPASLEQLWISNSIFLRATPGLIYEAASWPEIAVIELEITPKIEEGRRVAAAPVPDGREKGLTAIGAPALWAMGYTGYGTKAYIIDSGVDWDHPALTNSFRGLYVPQNQAWAIAAGNPQDVCAHGSHVTGTILGLDRLNNDTIGVAFNARWMAGVFQASNCPDFPGNTPSTQQLLQWAANPDGNTSTTTDIPDVINNSWGGGEPTACATTTGSFITAVKALETAGVAVVWSAGNDGPGASTVDGYAGSNYNLVGSFTVGAVNGNNAGLPIASFSSRGPSTCPGTGSLKIKPEVVAPGVSVRSSVPGGAYELMDGTSMATPHVSGAVLLLKEAFPNLGGDDILLALYNTAIDLGTAGEDNNYGMGMISLPAAFQYLVDAGNTPVPPSVPAKDVLVVGVEADAIQCGYALQATVTVENAGTDTITALTLAATLKRGSLQFTATQDWTGTILPHTLQTINFVVDTCPICNVGLLTGTYAVTLEVQLPAGEIDEHPLNNRTRFSAQISTDYPQLVTTQGAATAAACAGSSVLLRSVYSGPGQVEWYTSPGGTPIYTGNPFPTPELTTSQTYYTNIVFKHWGMPDIDLGDHAYGNPATGDRLRFNVLQPIRIKKVSVYTQAAGSLVIEACNATGTDCQTKAQSLQPGKTTVTLNFELSTGTNYYLRKKAGSAALGYNTSGMTFPYVYPGMLSITGSNHPDGAYMFFYDWEIEYIDNCDPFPTTVTVAPGANPPQTAFNAPDTLCLDPQSGQATVTFENTSTNDDTWYWHFGAGNASSTEENPTFTYTAPGEYLVALQATNAGGCSDAATRKVVIVDCVPTVERPQIAAQNLTIFPNPASAAVTLEFAGPAPATADVRVYDALGQLVLTQTGKALGRQASLSIAQLPAGWYRVTVQDGVTMWIGQVVKQ